MTSGAPNKMLSAASTPTMNEWSCEKTAKVNFRFEEERVGGKTYLVGDLVLVRTEATTGPNGVLLLELGKELLQLAVTNEGGSGVTVVLWVDERKVSSRRRLEKGGGEGERAGVRRTNLRW